MGGMMLRSTSGSDIEWVNQRIDDIRDKAWNVNFNPDCWAQLEYTVNMLYQEIDNIRDKQTKDFCEMYVVNKIANDMLLSYIICMQGNTHPIAHRILELLEKVDKKWTGPEDESMCGNLIDTGRYEICNMLNGFSFQGVCQYFIGLAKSGYFKRFGFAPDYSDTKWYKDELLEYLISGAFMDTDEHNKDVSFAPGVFGRLHLNADGLMNRLLTRVASYLQSAAEGIFSSDYDHFNVDNRLFAREKLSREICVELSYVLMDGDLMRYNINQLVESVVVTMDSPWYGKPPQDLLLAALSPIGDIIMRMIFEGHIMSGKRMAAIKTGTMVLDTILLRRNLENERTYIEYQDSIGRQDSTYAGVVFTPRRRIEIAGSGMW